MKPDIYHRYAIYWTPPPGPLAEFGAAWLGWDPAKGETPAALGVEGLPMEEITARPRRYGLHATIKAPFRLAKGVVEADVHEALAEFAARRAPVLLEGLALQRLGRFLCLSPEGETDALDALAADVVRDLDALRAPLTEAEITRREHTRLTPEAKALMLRWGYPHVMQRFRFHVSLTGNLEPNIFAKTENALGPLLAPLLPRPFPIEALSLMGEDAEGRFHLLARMPLTGRA